LTGPQAAIYGVVQGLTEFLPVSSSGHLALYGGLVERSVGEIPLALSVTVHVASLLAVVIVFRREIARLFGPDRRLGALILLGTVPAVVAGLLFRHDVERLTHQPAAVGALLVVTGLVLVAGELAARRRSRPDRPEQSMSMGQVLFVGFSQALALLPGISRSGMTISAGRSVGLDRDASVRFAFLLAVPAIAGAGGYELVKAVGGAGSSGLGASVVCLGFAAAFVSSWAALVVLIRVVRRAGLWVFSPYCFAVGAFAVAYFPWS
jgi:undecaprenyl-diphosphatase